MSPPEVWGPPIWTFFHKLAENVNESHFNKLKTQLFSFIKRICSFLPCPECSKDASLFLGKININKIDNKIEFKKLIYIFHNYVNSKKRKPMYNYSNIDVYKKYNMINVLNNFIKVYNTHGNMNLLTESFQRKLVITDFKKWFLQNIKYFLIFNKVQNIENNKEGNTEKKKVKFKEIIEEVEPDQNVIEEPDQNVIEEQVQIVEEVQVQIVEEVQVQIVEEVQVQIVEEVQVQNVIEEPEQNIEEQVQIVEEVQVQIVEEVQVQIVEEVQVQIVEEVQNVIEEPETDENIIEQVQNVIEEPVQIVEEEPNFQEFIQQQQNKKSKKKNKKN